MYENTPVGTQKGGRNQTDHLYTEDAVRGRRIYVVSGDVPVTGDGDFTVFHRLYDVCNLTVITDKKAVGYFDLFSKVTLK